MKSKLKTEWNLGLLYKSLKDPQIDKDIEAFAEVCRGFEEKYAKSSMYLSDEDALLSALTDYEELTRLLSSSKPGIYFSLCEAIKSDDSAASAKQNLIRDRLMREGNRAIFFELRLAKIPKDAQVRFLSSPKLAHFRYFLEKVFESAAHDLSESEEKIMNLKSLTSHGLWEEGLQRAIQKLTVKFRGKNITLSEASNLVLTLPRKERIALHDAINIKLLDVGDFGESEYNAICTDKKLNDSLRAFPKPYSSTFLRNQNTEQEVLTLIETVEENYPVAHKFYKLKKKILKLPYLLSSDRHATIGEMKKKIDFPEGYRMLGEIFASLNPGYKKLLDGFVERGQIDVFPRAHKRGGAFCASFTDLPTFVLLNWISNIDSFMTFAHEMGHAIHSEFTSVQSPLYQNYTYSSAEVASTLFEQLAFDAIFETLSDKEKIILLHDKICDALGSVFVQAAAFRFELEVHERIRAEGFLPKEAIADIYAKHMSKAGGPAVRMKREDGYMFIRWNHLRDFFYNYPYAYGRLVSGALYKNFKKDKSYLKKIEQFMSAGGSKSPHDIFMDIGIDTSKKAFWQGGIDSIAEDIHLLEKLLAKKK